MKIGASRFASFVLALGLAACGAGSAGGPGIQRTQLSGDQESAQKALVAEGDAAYALRGEQAQLELAVQKYEAAIALKQDDHDTYAKLSHAAYLLADGYYSADPARKADLLAMHQKGIDAGERGLKALSSEFEKKLSTGVAIEVAIKGLGREAVPLMYWNATNLGRWANAQEFTTVLKFKNRIFETLSHVLSLDPNYFYGAPDRYFGAFYSIAPPFAGGDLTKSYEHFQASQKIAPNYLGTYNLIAEFYAPKAQDPELFDRSIQFVLDAAADIIPELQPEAAIEKRKAEKLKTRRDELF